MARLASMWPFDFLVDLLTSTRIAICQSGFDPSSRDPPLLLLFLLSLVWEWIPSLPLVLVCVLLQGLVVLLHNDLID